MILPRDHTSPPGVGPDQAWWRFRRQGSHTRGGSGRSCRRTRLPAYLPSVEPGRRSDQEKVGTMSVSRRSHIEGDLSAGTPASLVWNQHEGRLRAGWRLLGFLAMLMVVAAGEARLRGALAGHLPDLYDAVVRA